MRANVNSSGNYNYSFQAVQQQQAAICTEPFVPFCERKQHALRIPIRCDLSAVHVSLAGTGHLATTLLPCWNRPFRGQHSAALLEQAIWPTLCCRAGTGHLANTLLPCWNRPFGQQATAVLEQAIWPTGYSRAGTGHLVNSLQPCLSLIHI